MIKYLQRKALAPKVIHAGIVAILCHMLYYTLYTILYILYYGIQYIPVLSTVLEGAAKFWKRKEKLKDGLRSVRPAMATIE